MIRIFTAMFVFLIMLFSVVQCGSSLDHGDKVDTSPFSEMRLEPKHVINKFFFTEAYSGYEYAQIADAAIVNLVQETTLLNTPQMFVLDSVRKSIFYTKDVENIKELYIGNKVNNPSLLAVSKDGEIYVADNQNKSLYKFQFNGEMLQYISLIYSGKQIADIIVDNESYLYIADITDLTKNKIIKLDQSGNLLNSIDLYKGDNNENHILTGLRSLFLTDNKLYVLGEFGRALIVFDKNGENVDVRYLSPKVASTDIAISNDIVYLASNATNSLLLLRKENLEAIGTYPIPKHPQPWGKIDNIFKVITYPSLGLVGVIGPEGMEIFTEQY